MSLIKSPTMTPRKLAAVRANGRKSAGPRTQAGKDKSMLNALKHGQYSKAFRSNLLKAREDVALYDWIYARILETFQPVGKRQWRVAKQWARETWCLLRRERPKNGEAEGPLVEGAVWSMAWTPWRHGGLEIKPRYIVKTGLSRLSFPALMRFDSCGSRLMFWVRRPSRPPVAPSPARDLLTDRVLADGHSVGKRAPSSGSAPALPVAE
jgi:hypothetical protein